MSIPIRTPDQRLRVFVSSTLEELAPERAAVRAAVEQLRLAPVMFELGARPHPPRTLYRAYLQQSHVFVGIYWQSYGWVAPDMDISGVEDEYELSAGKPSLVYVKEPSPERQPLLDKLLDRVAHENRVSFKRFETAEELGRLVADDLALLLAEHFEAEETGASPAGVVSPIRPRQPPVPPTALVGRERDVIAVCSLLRQDDVRLLTLSGVGGVGKTRLALAAAGDLRDDFADGVGFADLTSVSSPELVPDAIATAMGIRLEGTRPSADLVTEHLADADSLVLMDGFEHLVEAGSFVSHLLASCPSLRVMVTSRALLHLRGEHEYRVMPLETPPTDGTLKEGQVADAAAVRLFVERAREASPGFSLDAATAGAVAELCSRLEGIPLSIELAAARARVLSPRGLLDRLGDHLDAWSGPADLPARQRTLRATIDWSYDLLDARERDMFAALSVFVAGFTLDGAEAVVEPGVDAVELVSALVEKSLVVPRDVPDAEPRFRMIQPVRKYAEGRLVESGRADEVERRMVDYFARMSDQASSGLITAEHQVWLARLDPEVDNIRAAVTWASGHGDFRLCLAVLVPMWVYWFTRGYAGELRPTVEEILRVDPPLEPADRGLLLQAVASSRALTGEHESCVLVLRELIGVQQQIGDERGLALTKAQIVASSPPKPSESRRLLDEAIPVLARLGDRWGSAYALGVLGEVFLSEGKPGDADRVQAEAMEHACAVASEHLIGLALNERGLTALALGDLALARSRYAESAQLHRRVQNRDGLAYCLDGLAQLALAGERTELAAQAVGAADGVRAKIGTSVSPLIESLRTPMLAQLEDALGPAAFETARTAGRDTPTDRLLDELLT